MADKHWTTTQLEAFKSLDDFHVAPFHEDMKTTGTPTYIWSVVVDDGLYIRAGYGQKSRWFAAAKQQQAGKIELGGQTYTVNFRWIPETDDETLMTNIDQAYQDKYGAKDQTSTNIMIAKEPDGPRTTTVQILPA
ncbi:DUF2255 family protein [Furfurilactobacillus curtus]|uniref:DUF2255 family protein n=1 Tax=Furfurilactobacillus curtus TaxID=1746200 RepID=A0ABQ5JQM1_9LACO